MTNEPIQTHQSYQTKDTFEEDPISYMDIILVLARYIKLIIILPSIFCIITIIYVKYFVTPVYISTVTFMSSDSGGNNQSQMMGLATQFGLLATPTSKPEWSYEEIIKSRTMSKSLLTHRFDTEKYGMNRELLHILTYEDEKPQVGIDTLIHQAINSINGMIEISKTNNLYKLKISTFEPKLAADLTKAMIAELDRHQGDYNARKTTETRQFIEDRLIDTKMELETAEEFLKEFRERNRSILESPQLQLEQERLTRDVAVLIGVFTTLKQQLETAKIDEVKESDYVIILDKPEIPLYPFNSQKRLKVVLSGLLGIGLAVVLAFIRENYKNKDQEEKEKMSKAKSLIVNNITDFLPRRFRKT